MTPGSQDAYPIYEKDYHKTLDGIKAFIHEFPNLQCIGRAGMFRYNGMDHSILTGFQSADNIFGARKDLWKLNTEQSYLEEIEEGEED